MISSITIKNIATTAACMLAIPAFSHIGLEEKSAPAGSNYKAVFQVGHGCQGSATTGITVQIPAGFQGAKPYPKAGWTLTTKLGKLAKPYDNHGKPVTEDVTVVSWTAASKDAALQDAHFDEFMLRGKLPETAGPLWFKVLQTCESGSMDWSEVPASGASAKGLKSPAALLEVTDPVAKADLGQPVQVKDAWVRATVPGQTGSGAYMKITARTATRLVGISSPVAGVAEVHEMKMDGDVMKMRRVPSLDLPAGKTLELKSGAYHVMLMDLKQPLAAGSSVALSLHFKDAKGQESRVELNVPVAAAAPGASAAAGKAGEPDHSAHQH
ncbi:hypothetical protein SAMN05216344_102266 [Polaromonas sp. OV174]|uniref:DUF1775 domain-containing protein n=1 Tax=Polaromonas sp. OV174 TaxID=1855300 RepID=UPI0008F0243B|nr:DUF1775 domain-containing protein [Polaromonas sp. OV174]SFB75342.1 hypothetical protein SAMN05216344_102266 [Polaromonas sp. OV174]